MVTPLERGHGIARPPLINHLALKKESEDLFHCSKEKVVIMILVILARKFLTDQTAGLKLPNDMI